MMPSRRRLWVFRVFTAVAIPVLMLAALEGGLRLAGVGHPAGFTVPCSIGGHPGRCDNDRFTWQFFPPGAFRLPPSFAIQDEKPRNAFRIFIVGESAAQGDPDPSYSFGRHLEAMLRIRFPGVRFEVVNTAITAVNSHVLLPAVRDLARRQGDLFIVYAGNNEVVGPFGAGTSLTHRTSRLWLARAAIAARSTRIGQILAGGLGRRAGAGRAEWRGMEMFLEQRIAADHPALERVYSNFRANLRDLVAEARSSGAHVILSTVATNLRDSAPFASLHRPGLDPDSLRAWEEAFRAGVAAADAGDCPAALPRLEAAERIDAGHAELQFRMGRCAWALGATGPAGERFRRASDLDALRFRADGRVNQVIREVASTAGPGVSFVDGEAAVAADSPGGIPGREAFFEHVHLTPRGNHALARAIFPEVVALLPEDVRRGAATMDPPPLSEVERALALTGPDRIRLHDDVVRRLSRPPFSGQSSRDEQVRLLQREAGSTLADPARALAEYAQAIGRSPDDPWLRFNHGQLLQERDPAAAAAEFRAVLAMVPNHYSASERLANALVRLGRFGEAAAECRALLRRMPYHSPCWLTLAYALARSGDLEGAVETYERSIETDPARAFGAYTEIGRLRLAQGQPDRAVETFQKALDTGPAGRDLADGKYNLGHALGKAHRRDEARAVLGGAVTAYLTLLAGGQGDAAIHYGLASALVESGDLQRAVEHFRTAATKDPRDVDAHLGAVRALAAQGRAEDAAAEAARAAQALRAAGLPAQADELTRMAGELRRPPR
jgi:tetratricopeptide (TPR) repeat protein